MSSSCVPHHHHHHHQVQVRLLLRAGGRLPTREPTPAAASFLPSPALRGRRRCRVARAAMSAEARPGVVPAEEDGAAAPGQQQQQQALMAEMVEEAAVWCAVHGLVVGDRANQITKDLLRRGVAQDAIGIITPYNAQVNIIQQCTDGLVEVHTIDKYQGRHKECIIVSFVRSTANSRASGSSLLGDWHRINVLLTRAKKKLRLVALLKNKDLQKNTFNNTFA